MGKNKLYLHIGIGKTGTTSIQNLLQANKKNLADKKFFYPNTVQNFQLAINGIPQMPKEVELLYKKVIIEYNKKNCNTMILSCERFVFCRENYIRKVSEIFKDWDVKIIFYVRKQDNLLLSDFLQKIKAGTLLNPSFDDFFKHNGNAFKYMTRIRPWKEFFGKENIITRVYDDPNIKKDVCLDFNKIVGIESIMKENKIINSNSSIISEYVKLTILVNSHVKNENLKNSLMNEIILLSNKFKSATNKIKLEQNDDQKYITEYYLSDNKIFSEEFLSQEQSKYFLD